MDILRRRAHHAFRVELLCGRRRQAGVLREGVHQAGVEGVLLFGVAVILVGGGGLRGAQAEGVYGEISD